MILNHQALEEEKMEYNERAAHYKGNSTSPNNNLINERNVITNTKNINSLTEKAESNFVKHFSTKNLKNKNNDFNINKHLIDTKSNDILFNPNNNSNEFKTIDVPSKTKNNEKVKDINNDNDNYKNKKPNLITLNKDELYNAFILFQKLIKEENERINDIEYIKNRLFEFVLKHISENYDNICDNDEIFELQSYRRILCKSEKLLNINKKIFDFIDENDINIMRNYSYSFNINHKNKILYNNTKDTIKSSSQIFNEYLLINSKIKDKTITPENSKSFHHNYSFDLKNRDKNESSSHSIRNKDKDINNDILLENENNDAIKYYNSYNYENYNSYRKEIEYQSPFDDKNYKNKVLDNGSRKYSFVEDLLIEPFSQKNRKIKILDYTEKEEENIENYLPNKHSIKENLIISPVKSVMNSQKFENINNLESQHTEKTKHEIRVNKNKYLNSKEQIINEKVKELNEEIRKFREERNKVTVLKEEYQKLKENLNKEIKDFNIKKEINRKYYKNEYDKMRHFPQNESKLIMTLSQHNQSLILNNNKKRDTIKLLRKRIFELESIIKAKNEQRTNYKNIFRKIYNKFEKHYEHINIFTKKKVNKTKKNNDSYMLKKARINLKKNIESSSLEKIKGNEKVNQTMNNNMNINSNMNKIYFDSNVNKNISKLNDKKLMNISYNHQNIKNNILNSKLVNSTNANNCLTKCSNNVNSNRILIKKNLSNNTNITGLNSRNNSINTQVVNNKKNDNEVYHTNLYIYEKLIKKEREKEKEYKKININLNLERDLNEQRKIIKELKTEILEKNKSEKDKKSNKTIFKKCQRSQGKNLLINKFELKDDIKTKNNMSILSSYKIKQKNNSINKKNISAIRPLKRNATNLFKIEKLNNDVKKINNSLDTKDISQNLKTTNDKINPNNSLFINDDENDKMQYDFAIPKKYKMNNGEIIKTIDSDGKIINIYNNNKKEIIFKSGVRKEIFMDGYQLVHFPNGDMKQKFFGKDEKVIYYYNETSTVQTTFKNGLNIFKFSNGQIEKHYPDGSKYIIYTNGIKRKISKNGKEEMIVPDEEKIKEKKCYNSIENDNDNDNDNEKDNNDITNEKNASEGKNIKLSFLDIENENKSD